MDFETCNKIDMARASNSSNQELVEVHGSCMLDAELGKEDKTHMKKVVVERLDSVSYLSIISEIESLHRSQGLQSHHVTC